MPQPSLTLASSKLQAALQKSLEQQQARPACSITGASITRLPMQELRLQLLEERNRRPGRFIQEFIHIHHQT